MEQRILLVDDDEGVAKGFARVLAKVGYETAWACDGLVALKMLDASRYDAMVCDLFMPEREGLETIREARRLYPHMGIVVASGGFGTSEVEFWLKTARALGASVALAKPVASADLIAAVQSVMGTPANVSTQTP